MFLKITEDKIYEIKTTLRVSMTIEDKLYDGKLNINEIIQLLGKASVKECVDILSVGAGFYSQHIKRSDEAQAFFDAVYDNMDLHALRKAAYEMVLRLQYSGDDDEVDEKIESEEFDGETKNGFRKILGIPPRVYGSESSTTQSSSESTQQGS